MPLSRSAMQEFQVKTVARAKQSRFSFIACSSRYSRPTTTSNGFFPRFIFLRTSYLQSCLIKGICLNIRVWIAGWWASGLLPPKEIPLHFIQIRWKLFWCKKNSPRHWSFLSESLSAEAKKYFVFHYKSYIQSNFKFWLPCRLITLATCVTLLAPPFKSLSLIPMTQP